jgi:hypothetical protein
MPGYSVSIKERMLYSSCKNAVTEVIEKFYKIPIAKKVEVESGSEVTEQFLQVLLRTSIFICSSVADPDPHGSASNGKVGSGSASASK